MRDDSAGFAEVLLPLPLPGTYSYEIPKGMPVEAGSYVLVPLGSRTVAGVVWSVTSQRPEGLSLRPILELLPVPPMTGLHRKFLSWVANYYVEPPGNILRLSLRVPEALAPLKWQTGYRASGKVPAKMTAQRRRILELAVEGPPIRPGELANLAGCGLSPVKALIEAGALEPVALPPFMPFAKPDVLAGRLTLTPSQEHAAQEIRAQLAKSPSSVILLDGVTGSGKTEVYFEAISAALVQDRQVLLLVPEIALTRMFLLRVERRFGVEPAQWHSDLRPRERERVWRGVAEGGARIVVGARSALFLPWRRLGLIVVDEEHDGSYKQDDGVPYQARDMAVVYGSLGKFPVILSSATPSLESVVNTEQQRYHHVPLRRRHNDVELPEVALIDLRITPIGAQSWISEPLAEAVEDCLQQGSQALLFLNRRGYAPVTLCRACGRQINCPYCSAALVEHRFRRVLQCHHCGYSSPIPDICPHCRVAGKLVPCGPGIERLAEEAARRFPQARLAILSSDLSRGKTLRETLSSVETGKSNLVIGTQLVSKGHHFPHLVLVGVIDADLALESSDPRGGERTWQLMAQVAGRAGRGEKPGRAMIQTHLPEHPLMDALRRNNRNSYMRQEIEVRRQARLPPFVSLAAIIVSGSHNAEVEKLARQVRGIMPKACDVEVLGPAPAPMSLVRGRHRWRFLVKAEKKVDLQAFLRAWLQPVEPKGSLRIDIDVDPYNFL